MAPQLCASVNLPGIEVFIDLAGLIDVEAETARKKEEIARLEQFIAGKESKLANANFVARAPEAVVRKERDSLADLRAQLAAAQKVLETLAKP